MSFSWLKQHECQTSNKSKTATILVRHSIKNITNKTNDDIPRHKECTPDPADDFVMTNAGNFAKPNLPKNNYKSNRLENIIKKKRKQKQKDTNASVDVLNNTTSSFQTPYDELISLEPDIYLNETLIIKYFSEKHEMLLQGRLTCITHSGEYKIENVRCRACVDAVKRKLEWSYWLHFNSTRKIYISDYKGYKYCKNANKLERIDITEKFFDVVKFKMVTYLFYKYDYYGELGRWTIDYQLDRLQDSDLFTRTYIIEKFKQVTRNKVLSPIKDFMKQEVDQDFNYLERNDWVGTPRYLNREHLVSIVLNYRDLIVKYFESLNEISDIPCIKKDNENNKALHLQYFNWHENVSCDESSSS